VGGGGGGGGGGGADQGSRVRDLQIWKHGAAFTFGLRLGKKKGYRKRLEITIFCRPLCS